MVAVRHGWAGAWLAAVVVVGGGCRSAAPAWPDVFTRDHGAVVRGDARVRRLALVFTGGAYGEGTEFILDALRDAGVKAGFFVTGEYLAQPEYATLVERMVAEGHYVGPHSHAHPLYCAWEERERTLVTESFFRHDLGRNIDALRRLGALPPGQPVLFIPPYEWFNAEQVRWAAALDVTLFNFTPGSGSNRDWIPEGYNGFVSSVKIVRDILAYEERDPHGLNGFLLLLHLGAQREDKVHAHLPELLGELQRRGYVLVRVDELLAGATQ